jgi:hypothetical protein
MSILPFKSDVIVFLGDQFDGGIPWFYFYGVFDKYRSKSIVMGLFRRLESEYTSNLRGK